MTLVELDSIPDTDFTPIVDPEALSRIAKELAETARGLGGIGLSACQAGLSSRIFVVIISNTEHRTFVNCRYFPAQDVRGGFIEGCLSIGDGAIEYLVKRYQKIQIQGYELMEDPIRIKPTSERFDGIMSRVIQHEIDHQFGITIDQIGKVVR